MALQKDPSNLIVIGKRPNPELEELRDSVPQPPSVEEDVEELRRATSGLHVGFLFMPKGRPALRELRRFVLSARDDGDWQELAACLGLDPIDIRCIQNMSSWDPSYLTLAAFSYQKNASLDKVVSSLHQMKRADAICHCKPLLLKLVDAVLEEHPALGDQTNPADEHRSGLVTPPYLPDVPLPVKDQAMVRDWTLATFKPKKEDVELQRDSIQDPIQTAENTQSQNQLQEYAYLVMLTFASDGAAAAKRIAEVFRGTCTPDGCRVGVVILQEHSFYVTAYGTQHVLGLFKDVDYIVPIVTKEYVDTVCQRAGNAQAALLAQDAGQSCLDHKYALYIYQQMQAEYLLEQCVNARVRPVIVDEYVRRALHEFIMTDALFQSWCAESRVAELAQRLL